MSPGTLHERIAHCLGWPVPDTESFNLLALRELVRTRDTALADEITRLHRSGAVIVGRDVHRELAADILEVHPHAVTESVREKAKTIGFGLPGPMGILKDYARRK